MKQSQIINYFNDYIYYLQSKKLSFESFLGPQANYRPNSVLSNHLSSPLITQEVMRATIFALALR